MKTRRRILWPVLMALVLSTVPFTWAVLAAQDAPKAPAAKPVVEAKPEEVRPAFLTPRERSGTYVFLGWTWLTIGVLLYFLKLKIREADRVFRTGLYGTPGKGKEPPSRP
jgi:hypothetical protein